MVIGFHWSQWVWGDLMGLIVDSITVEWIYLIGCMSLWKASIACLEKLECQSGLLE